MTDSESSESFEPTGVADNPASEGCRTDVTAENAAQILSTLPGKVAAIQKEVGQCVIGQQQNVDAILYALLSYGHCLIEGVPGLAKTLLVRGSPVSWTSNSKGFSSPPT